jgi:hypothetical protein
MVRVSIIKLDAPAVPPVVTKLQLNVTLLALVLVTVNLSMIALTLTAVYWVVCASSACFAGISTFTVTAMFMTFQNVLKLLDDYTKPT